MSSRQPRHTAALNMLGELSIPPVGILCDSRCGSAVWDAPEPVVQPGVSAHSPAQWLGDGFGVSAGWQSVLACELLHRGAASRAAVSAIGCSQQAIGAVFAT